MSVSGIENVVGRLKLKIDQAKHQQTEAAITEMLIVGSANAASLTPSDTGTLLNSMGRKTQQEETGYAGYVYYGTRYAPWVNRMSGKLKGQPRAHFGITRIHSFFGPLPARSFGGGTGRGNYWDPAAEPHFLEKGMQEMAEDNAQGILKKHYSV